MMMKSQVKLQDEPPLWITELIASDLVMPMPKFSKYLTGCAALYPEEVIAEMIAEINCRDDRRDCIVEYHPEPIRRDAPPRYNLH